jgi:hypothetical protein
MTQYTPSSSEPGQRPPNFWNSSRGIASWLLTLDHKRIGVMYLAFVWAAFMLGGVFALLVRTELLTAGKTIVEADTYNQLFTLHGAVMVFLVIIPSIPASLGNIILPLQLGAKDVAFPRVNLASFYIYVIGALIAHVLDLQWRGGYRLDVLHPVLDHHQLECLDDGAGGVHPRLLVDLHRSELHRDGAPPARSRHDLLPHAAVCLGAVRHQR